MKNLGQFSLGVGLALVFTACGSESDPDFGNGGSSGGGSGGQLVVARGGDRQSLGGSSGGGSSGSGSGETPQAGGGTTTAGSAGSAPGGARPVLDEPKLVTSASGGYWKTGTLSEAPGSDPDLAVNLDQEKQTFTGFGGSFNERGWEALSWLSETDRARAIELLFDAADGAKFTYGRIPIGASDYATSLYTLNDVSEPDPMMEKFTIERDKGSLIPYIKMAIAVNPEIRFWGSPWTPPPWMKSNQGYKRGNMLDDPTVLSAFALYLAKFVEEYGKQGIRVMAIHPQNEPGWQQDYPSCGWSGELMAKFIGQYLGPTFRDRGVQAQIFIGTMSNGGHDAAVLNQVANDATAMSFVKGYGLQWQMLGAWSELRMDTKLEIWQTEHVCGNFPWDAGYNSQRAPNDHAYGVDSWFLIRDWIRGGVTAYSAWNMVLDPIGKNSEQERDWKQNALLTADKDTKALTVTPAYYVFRHVSQYVDPGAKVLGTSGADALAFKNPDGSVVTIVYNSGAAKRLTVAVGEKRYQFEMPGGGWATVNPGL